MVTVTCDKTGLSFEAASKRTKNHPQIMGMVEKANKEGWYSQCLESIKIGRKEGLESIEQFLALLEETRQAAINMKNARIDASMQRERDEKEARRQRFLLNAFLREHGYKWEKSGYADYDEWSDNRPSFFELWSPDNRLVSVGQALQELLAQGVTEAQEYIK